MMDDRPKCRWRMLPEVLTRMPRYPMRHFIVTYWSHSGRMGHWKTPVVAESGDGARVRIQIYAMLHDEKVEITGVYEEA